MAELFAKLPRRWKIGSYTFKVHAVPSDHPKLEGHDGYTIYQEESIYLDEALKPMRAAVVVLHELIHVVNWVFGVTDDSNEETVTTQISTGLMAFWQDNPRVMQWINVTRKLNG